MNSKISFTAAVKTFQKKFPSETDSGKLTNTLYKENFYPFFGS